jgi:hypothetical protein
MYFQGFIALDHPNHDDLAACLATRFFRILLIDAGSLMGLQMRLVRRRIMCEIWEEAWLTKAVDAAYHKL